MTVYVIFKEGVYRHECGGVFDTLEAAQAQAQRLADADVDTYHSYQVVPFELNAEIASNQGYPDEPDAVFSCEKSPPPPEAGVRIYAERGGRPNQKPGWVSQPLTPEGVAMRYRVRVDGVEVMDSIHAIDTIDGEVYVYGRTAGRSVIRGKVEIEEVPLTGAAS